jgi:hypothetical protein
MQRTTKYHHVDYFVNPTEVADYTTRNYVQLDQRVEQLYTRQLKVECEREVDSRQRVLNEAQGWFFQDPDKMKEARGMDMKACKKLEAMGQVPKGSF